MRVNKPKRIRGQCYELTTQNSATSLLVTQDYHRLVLDVNGKYALPADLKDLAVQLYHLALWLEQEK